MIDKEEPRRTSISAPGSPGVPGSPDGLNAATRLMSLFDARGVDPPRKNLEFPGDGLKRGDSEMSLDNGEEK